MEQDPEVRDPEPVGEWVEAVAAKVAGPAAGAPDPAGIASAPAAVRK